MGSFGRITRFQIGMNGANLLVWQQHIFGVAAVKGAPHFSPIIEDNLLSDRQCRCGTLHHFAYTFSAEIGQTAIYLHA